MTNSIDVGGDLGADISLLSESSYELLASGCKPRFKPAGGIGSFALGDSSSNDGSDNVISGPKSIFGRDISVGPSSLLARSLATSCRSLATPPVGAGVSFSSMPSRSIVEGEKIISVSGSEISGGVVQRGSAKEGTASLSSAGDFWPGDHCISGGADDGPGVMSPEGVGVS